MTTARDSYAGEEHVIGKLRCLNCGKETICFECDAVEYAIRLSWPKCCRAMMTLFSIPDEEPT